MMELRFLPNEIIVLSGPSSTGKSYFAAHYFHPSQVLSSDAFRTAVTDLEFHEESRSHRLQDGDKDRLANVSRKAFQQVSDDAFALLQQTLSLRAKYGKLTVVDATSLYLDDIERYVKIASKQHAQVSVVLFDVPLEAALGYDEQRQHPRGGKKIKQQFRALKTLLKSKREINKLGVRKIYVVEDPRDVNITMEENRLQADLGSGLDVMGDGHGLLASRIALIEKAGYVCGRDGLYRHPEGRKLLYLNDETSRGSLPKEEVKYGKYPSIAMLDMMKRHVEAGLAYAVDSNHNHKIWRWLEGRNVSMAHGDEVFVAEMEAFEKEYGSEKTAGLKQEWAAFLKSLPSHLIMMDNGQPRAVVAHAGIQDDMIGKDAPSVRDFCRFGPTDGFLEDGRPNRLDWTKDHHNGLLVIWGHVPHPEARVVRDSINLDQGGFYGHYLTLLRYPEMELVQEKVPKSFVAPDENQILKYYEARFEVPLLQNYVEGFEVTTKWGTLKAHRDAVKAAIEQVSTRTAPLAEMFYVPPTMSPTPRTSLLDGYLEHPNEAFDYFVSKGVTKLVIEKKHMGSRAILALFRTKEAGKAYLNRLTLGVILTRNNARFFAASAEEGLVGKLVSDLLPYFEEMNTDVLLLDAEIMPWNLKAGDLIRKQYGVTANTALYKRKQHLEALRDFQETRGISTEDEITKAQRRLENAQLFHKAFTYFCWNVEGLAGVKIAPFHVLGTADNTYFDKTHEWHMKQAERMAELSELMTETPYRTVDITDENARASVIQWWVEETAEGHEGFVFKPLDFVTVGPDGTLIQPAIKVRGREYLRIIYGMDYLEPEILAKLKKRSVGKKMRNAIFEFMLSMESVERFVKKERIDRIHECVLAAMSYESEPMDPRL